MSGRAGRRGMDDRGIVILMVDEKMSPTIGKQLLKVGEREKLFCCFFFLLFCFQFLRDLSQESQNFILLFSDALILQ